MTAQDTPTPEIALPPLPEPNIPAGYSEWQLQVYTTKAIELDRQQRGEPVAYGIFYEGVMQSWARDEDAAWEIAREDYDSIKTSILPLCTAPQPAAPAQEVSDEDILHLSYDHLNPYLDGDELRIEGVVEFARAVITLHPFTGAQPVIMKEICPECGHQFECFHNGYINQLRGDLAGAQPAAPEALTAADYEEVLADHQRLVRELDVLLNGEEGAAKQASLCDIVAQVQLEGVTVAQPAAQASLPAEWARIDPSFLLMHIRENTHYDAKLIGDMLAFAKAAATPVDAQPENVRAGDLYDDPAFESLCREHQIWGTAESALCAVFWRAGKACGQDPNINYERLKKALTQLGVSAPVSMEALAMDAADHINALTRAVMGLDWSLFRDQHIVPDGWRLVPVKPTETMLKATHDAAYIWGNKPWREAEKARWSAMLAAAPTPPADDHRENPTVEHRLDTPPTDGHGAQLRYYAESVGGKQHDTGRVYVRTPGKLHDNYFASTASPENAQRIAEALNRAPAAGQEQQEKGNG